MPAARNGLKKIENMRRTEFSCKTTREAGENTIFCSRTVGLALKVSVNKV